ncbi:hypothetical protein EIP91_012085 [Steccherinum ochraceum]|uniref:U3 small nucleolar RNA-associated protein 14 n=1 Tax=Steccherinum ochraceum TaxID=92696 RepID=A0A4V2MXR4_9APHY|nr:hypothetical protein EIP91_012085 [Steccherinum ochraceum]
MVRQVQSMKPRKSQVKDQKAYNARGYEKRQSLKAKKAAGGRKNTDVYEYQPEKERRSKVKLLLEKDEMLGARGHDSEDEDDDEDGGRGKGRKGKGKPRMLGEDEDDMEIGEDEDEEIDSDGAFDESDEERFAGFSFASQKKKPIAKANKPFKTPATRGVRFEVDLNEDEEEDVSVDQTDDAFDEEDRQEDSDEEEEEEEGEPDEFVDVLDILDGRGEPMSEDERESSAKPSQSFAEEDRDAEDDVLEGPSRRDDTDEDQDEDEDEDSEEELEERAVAISASEDEEEDEISKIDSLQTFITSLDAGQKRKLPEDDGAHSTLEARPPKRRLLQERTETGVENEFATHFGATKLNLDDLLTPLASTSSANLDSLKKSAKVLASTSSKHKTLSAPLPTRTQERLDREAAYEQTKEEVDKWNATMKRIKEAEHLSFPLQAPTAENTSSLQLAAKFKPTTELESAVDKLMKAANLRGEADIAQTETLKMNHLTVEEVAARRAELAKTRELMFRAEAKAKRVAKIKSKTYRRLKKKEKAKLADKLGEDVDVDELDEDGRLKMEVERARERATLKHKNTGKWAKAMQHRGELDADQRRDIAEMLDRGEKLRRRIRGEGSGSESEDDDEDSEEDEETIKARAFDELAALRRDDDGADPEASKSKSVFEMKFMKDAMARDRQRANQIADDFVKEMGGRIPHEDDDEEGDDAPDSAEPHGAQIERVGGRVTYRPGALPHLTDWIAFVPIFPSDTSSVTLKSTDFPGDPTSPVSLISSDRPLPTPVDDEAPANPWLVPRGGDAAAAPTKQRKHEVAVGKHSATAEKSKNKLRKKKQSLEEERARAKEDAEVAISMADVLTLPSGSGSASHAGPSSTAPPAKGKKSAKAKSKAPEAVQDDSDDSSDDSDANSELEEQEKVVDSKLKGKSRAVKAFEQRDIVARAFAGDNVVQQFAEAKRLEMQEDAPKEVDTTLPGWGSWGGAGLKKSAPKPQFVKKVAGVDPKTRADYNKAHVIISEKRDKKAAKYMVKDLPFPYTSKAQFERNMDTPLGTEWNTRVGFQRGTLPRVVTKPGTIISPLEKLL